MQKGDCRNTKGELKMSHKHQDIADLHTGRLCQLYTLDGTKPALICGRLNHFASIAAVDGSASIEVNWPTVARKMEGDGVFYAC
jgi:hypothetical protein